MKIKPLDICDCPGAWYGWTPKPTEFGGQGHVVIDPKFIEPALKWFRRKNLFYLARDVTTDKGIMFDLQIKPV